MSVLICLTLATAVGCNVQTGLAPTEAVIIESSDRDFGFVGRWKLVPPHGVSDDFAQNTMLIDRDRTGERFTVRQLHEQTVSDDLILYFRTAELAKDAPHSIVDIEVGDAAQTGIRRLAIAAVKDNRLHVWMINGKAVGEILYKEQVPAVIEHFTYSSTIRCSPQKLLDVVRRDSDKIISDVRIFERVTGSGK